MPGMLQVSYIQLIFPHIPGQCYRCQSIIHYSHTCLECYRCLIFNIPTHVRAQHCTVSVSSDTRSENRWTQSAKDEINVPIALSAFRDKMWTQSVFAQLLILVDARTEFTPTALFGDTALHNYKCRLSERSRKK